MPCRLLSDAMLIRPLLAALAFVCSLLQNPNFVKNYGFWLRYDSRSGTHNMYKEYRDVTLTGAVKKMYADLSSRHRARRSSIQIVKTAVVKAADTKRVYTQQFHTNDIKFRLLHRINRPSAKTFRQTFKATRPTTFF
jgi:large subunit ribosomal protein L18Ae